MGTAHIIVPIADIYREHTFISEVITQALMYEKVTILDTYDNWSKIEQWDEYQGWINNFYLDKNVDFDQYDNYIKVTRRFVKIYRDNDGFDIRTWVKNNNSALINEGYCQVLSYGTIIPYLRKEGNCFYHIPWVGNSTKWIYELPINQHHKTIKELDWLSDESSVRNGRIFSAGSLIGVPYKWGGKSGFGFDCSGFVQTVFKLNGIFLPRDSKEQYEMVKNNEKFGLNDLNSSRLAPFTGDLVFFEENDKICHVGIFNYDDCENSFVHCSSMVHYNFFIQEEAKRSNYGLPEEELFDKKLMDKFVGIFSISELIEEQLQAG